MLVYNKSLEDQWGKLFSNRWNGPFKVKKQLTGGSYILEELDGTELKRSFAASHIKRFYPRGRSLEEIQAEEEEQDLLDEADLEEFEDQVPTDLRTKALDFALKETLARWWSIHKEIMCPWRNVKSMLIVIFGKNQEMFQISILR